MLAKVAERERALQLRERGLSYSEILREISVSKSSLSLWLRSTHLRQSQKYRLKRKLVAVRKLGAKAKRKQRIEKTERIRQGAISEIRHIKDRELFYMGIMLYWAEGAKSRGSNTSQCVDFSNSDPNMCKFFLKWLQFGLNIQPERVGICIYIHESQKDRSNEVLNYWSRITGFPKEKFSKTCFTVTVYPRKKKRQDTGKYYGQLRLRVRRSTDLNRKIAGWVEGICLRSGVSL